MTDFTKLAGPQLLAKLGGDSRTQSHLAWQAIIDRKDESLAPQLRALIDTTDPNQRLMSAEAARQLGDFAKAKELMNFQFPEGYSRAVALISELIGKGDSALHEITA